MFKISEMKHSSFNFKCLPYLCTNVITACKIICSTWESMSRYGRIGKMNILMFSAFVVVTVFMVWLNNWHLMEVISCCLLMVILVVILLNTHMVVVEEKHLFLVNSLTLYGYMCNGYMAMQTSDLHTLTQVFSKLWPLSSIECHTLLDNFSLLKLKGWSMFQHVHLLRNQCL